MPITHRQRIIPFKQNPEALAALRAFVQTLDAFFLTGLSEVCGTLGSLVLGLSLVEGKADTEAVLRPPNSIIFGKAGSGATIPSCKAVLRPSSAIWRCARSGLRCLENKKGGPKAPLFKVVSRLFVEIKQFRRVGGLDA